MVGRRCQVKGTREWTVTASDVAYDFNNPLINYVRTNDRSNEDNLLLAKEHKRKTKDLFRRARIVSFTYYIRDESLIILGSLIAYLSCEKLWT